MKKDKEIEKVKSFLQGDIEFKEAHFGELLEMTSQMMVDLKKAVAKGSQEQREIAAKRLAQTRGLLYDYLQSSTEKLGLNKEEWQQVFSYFLHTASPDRDKLIIFKQEFDKNAKEVEKLLSTEALQKSS